MSSDPPSSGSLDEGWGSADDPSSQPPAAAALRVPKLPALSLPEEQGPLRDTIPPPVPVAVYVKTMMSQADDDEDGEGVASSPSGPTSWRGEPPLAQPESRGPLTPGRLPADLTDEYEGGVLSLRVPELPDLPITAEIDLGDLVDLVTLDEMDALAREGAPASVHDEDTAPFSDNPFPGAVMPVPTPEPAPHTLRTPLSDTSASVARRVPSAPDVVLGAPMEPEPLFSDGGGAMIDPAQPLNPYDFTGVIDEHPFSERPGRPVVSEVPATKPWSSSPPRPLPGGSPLPAVIDPRGSIPPILAAWSVGEAASAPSEHPPSTMKGPFGDPSPLPPRPGAPVAIPRPAATPASARHAITPAPRAAGPAPIPRTAPSAPIRPRAAPIPEPLPPEPTRDYIGEIQERLDVGDDLGAMMLAENLLTIEPDNGEASQCVEICRGRLIDSYLARLGGRRRVPRVVLGMDEIRYLSLDHRAGFLLSNIDGTMTVEEVLDVSGMAEFDALRLLDDFRERGVIEVPEPRRRR